MIGTQLSEISDNAAQRYGMVTETLRGICTRAIAHPNFGTPKVMSGAVGEAYDVARAFLSSEETHISQEREKIASKARQRFYSELSTDERNDEWNALIDAYSAIETHLRSELAIQCERDIALMRQSLARTAMQVAINARARQISMRQAAIQYQIGSSKDVKFYFRDRMNRRFPSRKYVRSLWRQQLLDTYNETMIGLAARFNLSFVEVEHLHGKAGVHGMRLSLVAGSENPTYSDVRDDVFHPNSDALLKPLVM